MNPYLLFVLFVLAGSFVLNLVVEGLNLRCLGTALPEELAGFYDGEKYARSQNYTRERTQFDLFQSSITVAATLLFILLGGFNVVDRIARSYVQDPILSGLIFISLLAVISGLFALPFGIYSTFVIEARYGFNQTTPKTFIFDLLKSLLLMVVIGGPVLTLVLWLFGAAGKSAWVIVWIAITIFQLVMLYFAPAVIMPLFNKFSPLESRELVDMIEAYARVQGFKMKGVFQMDGSKRSTKTNAFFTGFGRYRRIVLFDTLIARHSSEELLAILAHEMGHYKLRHVLKMIIASVLETGLLLFVLSLFIGNPGLFAAFKMEHISIYASLVFFGFLFSPLSAFLGIAMNSLSRHHELEADRYAARTTGKAEAFMTALKKLSVENLSNLTPHPLKVILDYSHPPVLQRIRSLNQIPPSKA